MAGKNMTVRALSEGVEIANSPARGQTSAPCCASAPGAPPTVTAIKGLEMIISVRKPSDETGGNMTEDVGC